MILRLCMEKDDPQGMRIKYQFKDAKTHEIYATASDNINESVSLYANEKEYKFFNYPKLIEKPQINIEYPLTSKRKKTIKQVIPVL